MQKKNKRRTSAKKRVHWIGIILFLFTIFAITFFMFTIFSLKANGLLDESEDDTALREEDSMQNRAYSEILVPNLVNQSFKNLQKEYKENQQFKICILDKELNDNIDIGYVVSQIPQKGSSVKRGSTIAVTLSLGPRQRTLPKIKGDSLFEAANKLSKSGFIPRLIKKYDSNIKNNSIVGYRDYLEGEQLDYKSEVTIIQNQSAAK